MDGWWWRVCAWESKGSAGHVPGWCLKLASPKRTNTGRVQGQTRLPHDGVTVTAKTFPSLEP